MPAPIPLDENGLQEYMQSVLGTSNVEKDLGWSIEAGDYQPAVEEVYLFFGTSDLTTVTDISRLRSVGRRELWRLVMQQTVGFHNATSENVNHSRSQIYEHALQQFKLEDALLSQTVGVTRPAGSSYLPNLYVP